jgi:hypothetical protein
MKSYLEFKENKESSYVVKVTKTKRFWIYNKEYNELIGNIYWRPSWRQYVIHFESETDWSKGCVMECLKFIDKLNAERKECLSLLR